MSATSPRPEVGATPPPPRASPPPARSPTLVVGYGSDLRGDDAAGRRAAEQLAELALPGVEVRSVTQLSPELADELSGRRVVFVDATVAEERVAAYRLRVAPLAAPVSHHLDPGGLLAVATVLDAPPREAWVVHIPAVELGLGTELSSTTREAVEEAVEWIAGLCNEVR